MKKVLLLGILIILLGYLLFDRLMLQIVWVNPNVNTKVFPYIAVTLKEIDKALNRTVQSMKSNGYNVKILYKNAYGSGFLQHNPIPNDLDYSIGIYLGEYEFDGKNNREIAKKLDEKMTIFQSELYNYFNTINPGKFYPDYDVVGYLTGTFKRRGENVDAITKSLPELFEHKDYVVYTEKLLIDANKNPIRMTFPFILKKNEILIEDFSPLLAFTNLIQYDKNTRPMLREVTVVTDFYADIKRGNDIVNAEIVAESFTGQRLQLSRRFFVPVIFTGNNSANYLKNLKFLADNQDYVEYRIFNFKRHLQEFANLKEMRERPVKLFKRVLQCADLIYPLLDEQTAADITKTIETNLNNPQIRLLNDWYTALFNLMQITSMPNIYKKSEAAHKVTEHLNAMKLIVQDMKTSNLFQTSDVTLIENTTNTLAQGLTQIKSPQTLQDYHKFVIKTSKPAMETVDRIIYNSTNSMDKIPEYIEMFNEIMKSAGFHRIEMCWLGKNLLGVVKDEFTLQIPEKDLKTMAKENKLPDADYKFIDKSELSGPKVRYAVWVRHNPTPDEEQNWQKMKTKLLQDKKNFKIKRRFTLLKAF